MVGRRTVALLFGYTHSLLRIGRRAGLVATIALVLPVIVNAQNTRNILVLHTYNANNPFNRLWSEAFREIVNSDVRNQVYEEYFDNDRIPVDDKTLAERLRNKYAGKRIDLVVCLGRIPLNFLMQYGNELWPAALKVFAAGDGRVLPAKLPADITGVVGTMDFAPTLDLALQLTPDTRRVFYVGGIDPAEGTWRRLVEEDFKRFADRVEITYINDLSLAELLDRLSRLPDRSVVIYPGLFRDASGHAYLPDRICRLVASASNAPVYGTLETYIGCGIVGGVVEDSKALAEETAQLALRVLERGAVAGFSVEHMSPNRVVVDWRQLQRWGIGENKLPSDAIVRFRTPSLWEQYKWYVLAGLTAIFAQLVLIVVLIIEMRRRRLSELAVKSLSGRIINATEEERKRIARELHDDIAQRLSLVSVELDMMQKDFPKDKLTGRESLHEPLQQVRDIITDVHNLSHQLHSQKLQVLGLAMALREICRQLSKQYGLDIQLIAEEIKVPLPEDRALCFYRVAQEALSNSVKHSRSSHVEVRLAATDGTLKMTIKDYGKGFDASTATNGLGLATMRERLRLIGGKLLITSLPGKGTELTAQVRLESPLRPGLAHDTAMALVPAAAKPTKDDENDAA